MTPLSVTPPTDNPVSTGSAPGHRRLPHHIDSLPAMPVAALLLVGKDPAARAIALGAARLAYPQASVVEYASLAEVEKRDAPAQTEILLLLRPSPAEIELATHARDSRGLPRWAVVVFGEGRATATAQMIQPEDWSPRLGAQALICAATLHELACDNERLRGDLRTVGRRINHDLRTPLNCVSTAGEGLRSIAENPASPEVQLTQSLVGAVDEISTLIGRVSFVLKATADPLPRQAVAMQSVVWDALQRFEVRLRQRNVDLTQPPMWPEVKGVASWLDVVWRNLLDNCLKHGGRRPRIELGWDEAGREFRFWIRDDGPGVTEEKRAQLFEPFDRLHDLHAPNGLGLAIIQRLIELQGGRCGCESRPGNCVFFFTLPVAE